jgi:hypothetical protein
MAFAASLCAEERGRGRYENAVTKRKLKMSPIKSPIMADKIILVDAVWEMYSIAIRRPKDAPPEMIPAIIAI